MARLTRTYKRHKSEALPLTQSSGTGGHFHLGFRSLLKKLRGHPRRTALGVGPFVLEVTLAAIRTPSKGMLGARNSKA
jgi:hypothetical protein